MKNILKFFYDSYHNFPTFLGGAGVVTLFSIFVAPLINNYYKHQKKIVIEDNSLQNINNKTGLPEPPFFESTFLSNFFLNNLTVSNKREASQTITKIELCNIEKSGRYFSDIQFDGGFDVQSQQFILLAYNNGNLSGKLNKYEIQFIVYEEGLKNEKTVLQETINSPEINSGEVISLFSKSLNDIAKIFLKDTKLYLLKINLVNLNGKLEKGMDLSLVFDKENNIFRNPSRGAVMPDVESIPIFNLTENVKHKSVPCSQKLSTGSNSIKFAIFIDRTCHLEYEVTLYSGKKSFKNKEKYQMDIRIPVYNQEHGCFMGDFFHTLENQGIDLTTDIKFTKENIPILDNTLIYNKYNAAEKFYDIKITK